MSSFNSNFVFCAALIFCLFWLASKGLWWSVAECSLAVLAYRHMSCNHTIAPHILFGLQCGHGWGYDWRYCLAFLFHYLGFGLVGRSISWVPDWTVWCRLVCSSLNMSSYNCIVIGVSNARSVEIMLGIPSLSIGIGGDVDVTRYGPGARWSSLEYAFRPFFLQRISTAVDGRCLLADQPGSLVYPALGRHDVDCIFFELFCSPLCVVPQ